jgi:hypothetical protein
MEYGSTSGATKCKTCPLGRVPKSDYRRYKIGCSYCRKGTIGKSDGKCHKCDGAMEYGSTSGLTKCKTCPLGTVPKSDYRHYKIGCSHCRKGTIGKSDGKCHKCNEAMEYGSTSGATKCKTCPLGTVPKKDYWGYYIGCSHCRKGTIGKSDGKCHKCDGVMEYGFTSGATKCKTCPLGRVPKTDYWGYKIGCSYCRKGTIGKSDGKCHKCVGAMEYGSTYGATKCKTCQLGWVPKTDYRG